MPTLNVPSSAYEAWAMSTRHTVRLDSNTRLVRMRHHPGGTRLDYRAARGVGWREIVRYLSDGTIQILPTMVPYRSNAVYRRINAVLPHYWEVEFRPNRYPRLVFRGQFTTAMSDITFRPNGDIQWGVHAYADRLTLAQLHAEANEREGVTPLPSRRRPRPAPSYLVMADLTPPPGRRRLRYVLEGAEMESVDNPGVVDLRDVWRSAWLREMAEDADLAQPTEEGD